MIYKLRQIVCIQILWIISANAEKKLFQIEENKDSLLLIPEKNDSKIIEMNGLSSEFLSSNKSNGVSINSHSSRLTTASQREYFPDFQHDFENDTGNLYLK